MTDAKPPSATVTAPTGGPRVPFAFAGGAGRRRSTWGRRELLPGAIFSLLHLSTLALLQAASRGDPPRLDPVDLGTVTYVDVAPPVGPESPRRVNAPAAPPTAVVQGITIPAAQGGSGAGDKAAGFQELLVPKVVAGVPSADSGSAVAVDEKDYSGRGVVGGVAGGKPPPVISLAAALELQGRISDRVADAAPRPQASRTVRALDAVEVDVKPELTNRDAVLAALLDSYPPMLREAGVDGSAVVQFVVDSTGAVDPSSIVIVSATHPPFGDAATRVVVVARFKPGRTEVGGRLAPVPVTVRIPLNWTRKQREDS